MNESYTLDKLAETTRTMREAAEFNRLIDAAEARTAKWQIAFVVSNLLWIALAILSGCGTTIETPEPVEAMSVLPTSVEWGAAAEMDDSDIFPCYRGGGADGPPQPPPGPAPCPPEADWWCRLWD